MFWFLTAVTLIQVLVRLLELIRTVMSMEMNGRALPPSIPEDGEAPDHVPHGEMNGIHQRFLGCDGGEAEVPVSKSQRRKSDVKVYKEFCDFYARL